MLVINHESKKWLPQHQQRGKIFCPSIKNSLLTHVSYQQQAQNPVPCKNSVELTSDFLFGCVDDLKYVYPYAENYRSHSFPNNLLFQLTTRGLEK